MLIAFFPLIAAALYGLSYALIGRITETVNLTTYYLMSCLIFFAFSIAQACVRGEGVSFAFAKENPSIFWVMIVSVGASSIAWFFTTQALKNISATYAAFGEISYPLFTMLFAFLIFGARQFSWTTVAGGLLIMAGSFILIAGQTLKGR